MLTSKQTFRMISRQAALASQAAPRAQAAAAWDTPRTRESSDTGKVISRASSFGPDRAGSPSTHLRPPPLAATQLPSNLAMPHSHTSGELNGRVIIAFISGPVEADMTYFQTHYVPRILSAIQAGHHFVLGSSRGIDSLALRYLLNYTQPRSGSTSETVSEAVAVDRRRITVYLTQPEARNPKVRYSPMLRQLEEGGGRVLVFEPSIVNGPTRHEKARREPNTHWTERDEAMTRASHYDILRYRTAEECRVLYGMKYRKRVSGTEKNELRRAGGIGLGLDGIPDIVLPNLGPRK